MNNEITVKAPENIDCDMKKWTARYTITGTGAARLVRIQSRSALDIVIAKIAQTGFSGPQAIYYISSPNFGVAIPGISSLEDTYWITEQLILNDMPAPDAVTVASVLQTIGDF